MAARVREDRSRTWRARVLAALFVIVAGFDVISTNAALAAGHAEGNPLIEFMQLEFGSWWSLPKVAFHLGLAMLILWLPSRRMLRMAGLVVLAYAAIILNNLYLAGVAA